MGCNYSVYGSFEGDFSEAIANEIIAASDDEGIYGEAFDIDYEGNVNIWGSMSYSNACAIDDFLKAQALKYGLMGRFETNCDDDIGAFYVGTPEQQRNAELAYIENQMAELAKRKSALQAMTF